jgi:hypothetical protein
MGLADVQGALARIYIDPVLRDRLFAEPVAVGTELGLNAEEALGLAAVPRRQVERFADSLRHKRRDQVRRAVPIAARAIGESRFAELFERYTTEAAPRGSKADLDDAAGFVEALRRWADQVEPPWAIDLARYELAWRKAVRAGRAPLVRTFRYPVGRLATGRQPERVAPGATLALWWRPTRRGGVRHIVISMPRMGFGRK